MIQPMKSNKHKNSFSYALTKSVPIMCSYFFVSMAYGMMMTANGFPWYDSLLVSMTVYTGAFQFVLTTLLSSGASLLTIAATAFLMNSRQILYSITFIHDFGKMGIAKPYMIHTLTDETYAFNCTLSLPYHQKKSVMLWIALMARCSWMIGAVFIDQWEKAGSHIPACLGLTVAFVCLMLFGETGFMLPALIIVSAILVFYNQSKSEGTANSQ